MEREMKEWKVETEGWWKEKASLLQMFFSESTQWKKEKEDLHAEIQELRADSQALKEEVSALKRELADRASGGLEEGEI